MQLNATIFDKNVKKITFFIAVALSMIFCRLFYLQIYLNNEFFTRAQKNFTRTETITPQRGNITDCNGNLLATNRPTTNVYWQGTGNRQLNESQKDLLIALQTIADQNFDEKTMQTIRHAERFRKKTKIINDLNFNKLSKLVERFSNNQNMVIENNLKRYYPYKSLACHILGYISSMQLEQSGKMGLEKIFETNLKGSHGQLIKMMNSFGTNLYEYEVKQALSGKDLKTTLDLSLQQIAERSFEKDQDGALLIIDPANGAIKALVSRPTFDPMMFLSPINIDDWQSLQHNQPFLNRAFNACYPPASTFKLISLSAALELGILTPDSTIECKGFIKFGNRKYHCGKRAGHGILTVEQAVAESCNILFYEIGKTITIDNLADYAKRFGLGKKTNILLGEQQGLVPTTQWKLDQIGERWWAGETVIASIGQGYLLASPIQIACMTASIFQGYMVTPRILIDEVITMHPFQIQYRTRKFLKKCMKSAVQYGTAKGLNTLENIKIYAKTGTAQQISTDAYYRLPDQFKEHIWFVAYFHYKHEKPLVLTLLLERAGNYRQATALVKRFFTQYCTLMAKAPETIEF
jgi:penicillin-binding protein 2